MAVRKLSDAETYRIYDRNKFMPGVADKATMASAAKVMQQIVQSSVTEWKGFTDETGIDLPCTDENKLLLIDTILDGEEGEKTTLWHVIAKKFGDEEEAERKN